MIDQTLLDDLPVAAPGERCRYPSKFCRNRRSLKRNGELHRFCDHHRTKANLNQKRWSKSRRGGGASPTTVPTTTRDGSDSDSSQDAVPSWATVADALAHDDEQMEDEMKRLADAPSFTSMLSMLHQSQPSNKPEIPGDEQLSEFLRELLQPQDPWGLHDAYTAQPDQHTVLVQL